MEDIPQIKSIAHMPWLLIEETVNNMCDGLRMRSAEIKCLELKCGIDSFQSSLRRWIVSELLASSIVEVKEEK